ncbi:MAG: sensor histidine kinase [Pseudomonadales bacterium]|nr:sensor histidine kinase [Pseudomonadales bacterium]
MSEYSNQTTLPSRSLPFVVPELCNVGAISLLVLFGELLVLVLLFAGGEVTWIRLALMSLFVQWVTLASAGILCTTRKALAHLGLVAGAVSAFCLVMAVTLSVGIAADRILADGAGTRGIDWQTIFGQLVISGIITALALRYFYVQQQLRVQEQSELRSRIQAMQSRIRPHFLFNSMNIIASLIASDPETAEVVVEDLSELFRASLNDAGNQVPLTEELDLCERYVRIEALRLGERLRLDWQVDPIPESVRIPLLTLQPLLENAIYHGIQPLPDGGTIRVRLWLDKEIVNVEISNPLPAQSTRHPSQGNRMALNNIRSRLNVLYGARAELKTEALEDRFVTTLKYPMLHNSEEGR